MAAPRRKSDWAQRVEVAVETSVGSGMFEVDERLRADSVEALSGVDVGTARLSVRTGGDFTSADAVARYYADRRMIVRSGTSVLFDGHPSVGRLDWRRRGPSTPTPGRDREFGLELEHVVGRLRRDVRSQILGRYVRDGVIMDGMSADSAAWLGVSTLVRGLPCVFNMDGVGNCDPEPIVVDDGGATAEVHIFADDARDDAIPWTYANVLRYLLHFHVESGCPVQVGQVFTQTDAVVSLSGDGRDAFLESDPLAYALLGEPDTLMLEATSLLEAIALVSAASGLQLTAESVMVGRGVRTSWRVWTDLSGPARELHLATDGRDEAGNPLYDPATKAALDLFAENDVSASSMAWDARSIGETVLVAGDVQRYEVQADLVPGWLPEADLDNVSPMQVANAKAKALTDEQILAMGDEVGQNAWYRAYHRDGADFAATWRVGRLWVLNEAGTYDPSQYNRNAPFDSYAPYDFSAVFSGRWMRRRRRLLPVARRTGGAEQVLVEVSLDSGASWMPICSGYVILSEECGLWFDVANPLSIAPPGGGAADNLWYALIHRTFRIRVTALVESDERLTIESTGESAPTLFRNATVLYTPERFRFVRRLGGGGNGSGATELGPTAERDDSELMSALAESTAAARGTRAVTARPVIPWLDTSYAVGDRIVGVRGRGVELSTERRPGRRHACVVGKRYRFGAGRFETELILAAAGGADATRGIE